MRRVFHICGCFELRSRPRWSLILLLQAVRICISLAALQLRLFFA